MAEPDLPEDLKEHRRSVREHELEQRRKRWDSLTPAQRRQEFAFLERWSRRWREQSTDSAVNNALTLVLVLAALVILLVLGGVIWLLIYLFS